MPKFKELINLPPEPEGGAEEQLAALRDYLVKIIQELQYLLSHLEPDNINDDVFQQIYRKIPQPYGGLPLMDGAASSGGSGNWARGDHRHPSDSSKADASVLAEVVDDLEDTDAALAAHVTNTGNPHEVTKAQVGLGNVADERQYSADNPPPTPSAADVGAIPVTDKGNANGVAELDSNGLVPSAQLPSYVDDVLEYPTAADFPVTGENGKIYVALDTNRTYRWSGSAYIEISESLALGETSSTAYRGDRGKTAYDHSQTTGNPHGTTAAQVGARPDTWTPSKSDIGLGNVDNVQQYSAQNPPPLPTPADIGAATAQDLSDHVGDTANPHSVTAAQVGARPDTWTPSAADVGAQPTINVSGILKGDGTGGVSAATAGTDYGTYSKPSGGIPSSDMASGVQTSLGKADTAYQKPSGGIPATDLANGVIPTVPSAYTSNPAMDGTASPGSTGEWADGGHVHPSDTSKANQAQLAVVESGSTASRAYAVGEYFCWQGTLYRATAAISNGGTFTPGTNCEAVVVGDFLYNHEYPNEQWFALAPGKKLTIHINGTTTSSAIANLLISFTSNVNTLRGGLAWIQINDGRANMHWIYYLAGALPVDITMTEAVGSIEFSNNTAGAGTCNINVTMLGSRQRNITFTVS